MNRMLVAALMLGGMAQAGQAAQLATRTVKAVVTAYCPCRECCGTDARGVTSTGRNARRLSGCAVDPKWIPYGCRVHIPGVGWRTADDTGSAMRRSGRQGIIHVDVRMGSHEEALRFGVRRVAIRIEEPAGRS